MEKRLSVRGTTPEPSASLTDTSLYLTCNQRDRNTGPYLPASFNGLHLIFLQSIHVPHQTEELISNKQVNICYCTYQTGQLMAKWKKKKKINSRKEHKSVHFIILAKLSMGKSAKYYTMLYAALAALPKFPTSTSILQSVYCLPLACSPYCPCPLAKLLVQIAEVASMLKWTPAASLCPSPHFSNILTVTLQEPLGPISWSF